MKKPTEDYSNYSHANIGQTVSLHQDGNEVRLVMVAKDKATADSLVQSLLTQLKNGKLVMTLGGKPTSITET